MNGGPDALLTLSLLAPCLVVGIVAAVLLRPAPASRTRRSRRLTDTEVRAMYRITAERARQGQWN